MTDETAGLVNPFLQMIVSVLKFSQKRKISQPHFTLSIEGLYQIYQAGSVCNQATKGINPDFALEAILMSAPPTSLFLMVRTFIYPLHLFISGTKFPFIL
jgi:nucleolar pre-ribosomal-associated protein 1